jgi:hypothetical protein
MGYGDGLPAGPATQMLAVASALIGSLPVAVVIGLLINRRIAQQRRQMGSPAPPAQQAFALHASQQLFRCQAG